MSRSRRLARILLVVGLFLCVVLALAWGLVDVTFENKVDLLSVDQLLEEAGEDASAYREEIRRAGLSDITLVRIEREPFVGPFALRSIQDDLPNFFVVKSCLGVFIDEKVFVTAAHCEGASVVADRDMATRGLCSVEVDCEWKNWGNPKHGCREAEQGDWALCRLTGVGDHCLGSIVPIQVAQDVEEEVSLELLNQSSDQIFFEELKREEIGDCFQGKLKESSAVCRKGDSGGPVYVVQNEGKPRLVAVLSSPGNDRSCWMSSVVGLKPDPP